MRVFIGLLALAFGLAAGHAEEGAPVTEVVVIGTQHFITDLPEGFTPGHLRALLTKIAPQALAVEAPTNVPNPWDFAPYELAQVTKLWAQKSGIETAPIGWNEPRYQAALGGMFAVFSSKGTTGEYQHAEAALQSALGGQPGSLAGLNHSTSLAAWRDYHAALHRLLGRDTPWEEWNAHILDNLRRVCAARPGKRIAVVFGAAHAYCFLDHLRREPGVRVRAIDEFLPLTEAEIAAATQPLDFVKALRRLNFPPGSLGAPALEEVRRALSKVGGIPEFAGDFRYFTGRLRLHEHRPADALAEFDALRDTAASVRLVFDGVAIVREMAAINAAIAKAQSGSAKEARERLETLLQQPGLAAATIAWAQQLRQELSDK